MGQQAASISTRNHSALPSRPTVVMRACRLLVLATTAVVGLTSSACTGTSGRRRTSPTSGSNSTSGTAVVSRSTRRYSLGGATIVMPKRWSVTPYKGEPATVVFPIVFLSSSTLVSRCARGHPSPASCTTRNWFPPDVQTPASGVLVLWLNVQFPTDSLDAVPGRQTHINQHVARVYAGPADGGCPEGAAREIDAYVRIATKPYGPSHLLPGGRIDMTACVGQHASADDRGAVTAMLHSLHIRTSHWYHH
jgi:hypothetical protein